MLVSPWRFRLVVFHLRLRLSVCVCVCLNPFQLVFTLISVSTAPLLSSSPCCPCPPSPFAEAGRVFSRSN